MGNRSLFIATAVLIFLSRSASASVTCDLVEEKPKGNCPCLRYLVNCDGQLGWADGTKVSKEGEKITFSGHSVDLYSDRQLYPGKIKKVATIKGSNDAADCTPGKPVSAGKASAIRANLEACNDKPIYFSAFPEDGACQNWSVCPHLIGGKEDFAACNKLAADPTRLKREVPKTPLSDDRVLLEGNTYASYRSGTATMITVVPSTLDPGCKPDPVRFCVSGVTYEKKNPDGSFQEFGNDRVVCEAVSDSACKSMKDCIGDHKFNMGDPDFFFPKAPGTGKSKGTGTSSKEAK
jgi:hypothetical protein